MSLVALETLPPWRQKLLAVALLVAVMVGLWQAVGSAVEHFAARNHDLDEARDMLVRLRAVAARQPALAERLARQEAAVDTAAQTLLAASPALAAGRLQGMVKQVVERAGGTVQSMQPVELAPQRSPLPTVAVEGLLSLPPTALVGVIHGLEAAEPFLFIDRLVIQARAGGDALQLRIRVFALVSVEGPEAPS